MHWKIFLFVLAGVCLGALVGYGISTLMRKDPTPTFFPIFLSSSIFAWLMLLVAVRRYAGTDFELDFMRRERQRLEKMK